MVDDPLNLDVTRPLRGVNDLAALVRYVLATNAKNETTWLEWKRMLDLTTSQHRFDVAKQILGFSNREPDRAAAYAGGCAYVVIGAEPSNLAGQDSIDPADLEAGLRRYALRKAGHLTANDEKDVTSIAGLRNDAAHGKFDVVTRDRAALMADQVNLFMRQRMVDDSR